MALWIQHINLPLIIIQITEEWDEQKKIKIKKYILSIDNPIVDCGHFVLKTHTHTYIYIYIYTNKQTKTLSIVLY